MWGPMMATAGRDGFLLNRTVQMASQLFLINRIALIKGPPVSSLGLEDAFNLGRDNSPGGLSDVDYLVPVLPDQDASGDSRRNAEDS